eukprot:GHVT01084832.1.p2 GENE.GHVT01084832.1~~GHVT01084832.1.p2  ORF type:complete len:185 (+),score=1.07 GHVT01084832.1:1-555(+)
MPLTVYGDTSSDEEGVEILEESDKRNRKAPERFGQWVRVVGVSKMSGNIGESEAEGAQALLDLRYGGNDVTIRSTTPAKYPRLEGVNKEPAMNTSFGKIDNILWRYLLTKARRARKNDGDVARFPRHAHVTHERSRVTGGRSLVDGEGGFWGRRKSAIVKERLVRRGREVVESDSGEVPGDPFG